MLWSTDSLLRVRLKATSHPIYVVRWVVTGLRHYMFTISTS